jgi:hypothetical protein
MDYKVVTDRPTQEILNRAHKQNLMVFTFIHKPNSVIDYKTAQAFQEGWLMGLELKPDHRLALILVPINLDLEEFKLHYLERLEESVSIHPLNFNTLSGIIGFAYE